MRNTKRLSSYESPAFNVIILLGALLLVALVAAGAVGAAALLRARPDSPPVGNPTLAVQPASGGPGTAVLVTGTSFPGGAPVSIYLEPASGQGDFVSRVYGQPVAGENGDFSLSFPLPEAWEDGTPLAEGQIIVRAVSGGGVSEPVAIFSYQPPPAQAPTPVIHVSPLSGRPNDIITITGEHFVPGASVRAYLIPQGLDSAQEVDPAYTHGQATSDDFGGIRIPFEIPAEWPDGAAIEAGELAIVVASEDFSKRALTRFTFEAVPVPETEVPVPQPRPGGSDAVPVITFTPAKGESGTRITVQGRNFPADSSVMLRLADPASGIPYGSTVYAAATTDHEGQFSSAFVLPARWPDGKRINDGPLSIYAMTADDGTGWYSWANVAFSNPSHSGAMES